MKTEFGTSYNAYLLRGSEKTALVETCHTRFFEVFKSNVEEIMPISDIDYVVFNHTEPDHSGSLERLLEYNPNIKAVGSVAAIRNLSAIANKKIDSITVKNGDKLDLGGGISLDFVSAPNLHWPDSIFSYCESLKTVFTCDFLGSHYCEPTITDDFISYPENYWSAFRGYFDAIMGPFKKFVLDGIAKLEKLDFDMVCTSHGPVLKNNITEAVAKYKEWSQPKDNEKTAAIFYVSAYGYTEIMADALAVGMNTAGVKTEIFDIIKHDTSVIAEKIEKSSAYLFGSPTINRDAVKPVWDTISMIDPISNKGKKALVFGSYGWSGEACKNLSERLRGIGIDVVAENERILFKPSEEDIQNLKEIGKAFAETIK
ncbi:MAG: FprA family A-type flavoprotein [Clostridiales bacterium]|nr:FprA family A-type flavoprotein [Clostridiales bacterium]